MLIIRAQVKPSPIHGMGCFTIEDIAKGQVVWEFHPQVDRRYTLKEIAQLPPIIVQFFRTYAWLNPADNHILFTGDHSKFFNHSDTPNTTMTLDGYQCVAKRDIIAGEELTINYVELPDILDVPGGGPHEV